MGINKAKTPHVKEQPEFQKQEIRQSEAAETGCVHFPCRIVKAFIEEIIARFNYPAKAGAMASLDLFPSFQLDGIHLFSRSEQRLPLWLSGTFHLAEQP